MSTPSQKFTLHFSSDTEDELGLRFVGPMDKICLEDLYDLGVEFEDDDGDIITIPLFASIVVHPE
ncbi:MAG: hypothetical protein ACI80V_001547 [Rhodothermales bacterium]|jgi:hypothetical protein